MLRSSDQSAEEMTGQGAKESAFLEGGVVGCFRIIEPLGCSRPASVFAAIDAESGSPQTVALKPLRRRQDADGRIEPEQRAVARLRREAEVLRALDGQSGVPRLLRAADGDDPPHLILELIDSVDLDTTLSDLLDPLPAGDLASLLIGIADILAAVHRVGFVHGDVQPLNVLLRSDGTPALVDFGSARRWETEAEQNDTWGISLTPGYAAPEWHEVGGRIGPWSDIYSLGAIGYRAVVGRPPASGADRLRGVAMPGAVEIGRAAYPLALRAAIDWALEIAPSDRPPSIEEWRETLRSAAGNKGNGATAPRTVRVRRVERRRNLQEEKPGPESAGANRRQTRHRRLLGFAAAMAAAILGPVSWMAFRIYEEHMRVEWVVDPAGTGHATTLADALSRARNGATIRVGPGIYPESLTISRSVAIIGIVKDGHRPLLQPPGPRCVLADAETAQLSDIDLRGAPAAGGDATVPCLDVVRGRLRIERADIAAAAGAAVTVRNGAELHASAATVSVGNAAGIVLLSGSNAELQDATIRGVAGSGILARGGANLTASGVTIEGPGHAGILLAEGAAARMERITVASSGNSGLELLSGATADIAEAVIVRSAKAGIFVADSAKATLNRAQISDSGFSGAIAAPGSEIRLTDSEVKSNGEHGLVVMGNAFAEVRGSRIVENAGHGIALQSQAHFEAAENGLERNTDPQLLDESQSESSRQSASR